MRRPNKGRSSTKADVDVVALQKENDGLRRRLTRARKELRKYTSEATAATLTDADAVDVPEEELPLVGGRGRCPKCKSPRTGEFVTPAGSRVFVCGECQFRQKL